MAKITYWLVMPTELETRSLQRLKWRHAAKGEEGETCSAAQPFTLTPHYNHDAHQRDAHPCVSQIILEERPLRGVDTLTRRHVLTENIRKIIPPIFILDLHTQRAGFSR